MKRTRPPQEFDCIINFDTGDTDMVPEHPEGRRLRLKRESARRRSEAFSNREAINDARKTAITLAWRLANDGKTLPIHIDLELLSGAYSSTERFTLIDAAFTTHIFREDEIVGSFGASAIRRSRPASVPADVIHRVRLR